jgi:hypothetical protein
VRSLPEKEKRNEQYNKREERPFEQGSLEAHLLFEGPKNNGRESARIKHCANDVVSSLMLVNNQPFGQCALALSMEMYRGEQS